MQKFLSLNLINWKRFFISKDAKKVEAARAELEKKYEQYKKEYEPWSEKTKEFNEQATKYFEEDKEVLERRSSNPYIKEFKSVFKALHLVALIMLTFQIIIVIVDLFTRGWTHFSNGPLLFFWFSFFGREMLEFYVDILRLFLIVSINGQKTLMLKNQQMLINCMMLTAQLAQ